MINHIDWVSFSVPMPASGNADERTVLEDLQAELHRLDPGLLEALDVYSTPLPSKGRAPYRHSWQYKRQGVTLFTHPNLNHALVEISGHGCQRLIAMNVLDPIIQLARNRITRLDVASDMFTGTRPLEFVGKRHEGRYKSHSEVVSSSGETCYVGSAKSDRYARVYRYNPPHERSNLLRCEFVVKGETARLMVDTILSDGIDAVAASLGIAFGWQHPSWTEDATAPAELTVWRPERRKGKTAFWLADTVAPLLVKMHNAGDIDIYQWLQDYVIPRIIDSNDQ